MRELKFRAWDITCEEMWTPFQPVQFEEDGYYKWEDINNDNCNIKLMQYTGFTDKHGAEIYEGDILSDYTKTDEGIIQSQMQVFWCSITGCWKLDNSYNQDKSSGDMLCDELHDFNYEITGHIYLKNRNSSNF
jgi:uncharacterized phage protein (TIGR01671 family)